MIRSKSDTYNVNDTSLLISYNADGMTEGCDDENISNPCSTLNKEYYCSNNTIYNCGPCGVSVNMKYTVLNIKGLIDKGIRFDNYDHKDGIVCGSGIMELNVKTQSK